MLCDYRIIAYMNSLYMLVLRRLSSEATPLYDASARESWELRLIHIMLYYIILL